MQAADTERVRIDDWTWRITCANPDCGKEFYAKRSDASYCCGACRTHVSRAPIRKQHTIEDIQRMAFRCLEISHTYPRSQDVFDQMVKLEKALKAALDNFDTTWKQEGF